MNKTEGTQDILEDSSLFSPINVIVIEVDDETLFMSFHGLNRNIRVP